MIDKIDLYTSKNNYCDVHEVQHPSEQTIVYQIQKENGRIIYLQVCNLVAMTLGLTQKDAITYERN